MRVKITPHVGRKTVGSPDEVEAAIEKSLDANARATQAEYEKTVATWNDKPVFTITKTKYGRSIGTRDKIYKFVDGGTRPHIIKPKGPGYPLRFATGGSPKTKPQIVSSYNGKPGDQPRAAYLVHHPGTKARGFTKILTVRARERQHLYFRDALKLVFHGK